MQVSLNERGYGFDVSLNPETPEETMQLLRMATNAKPINVNVIAYYSGKSLTASIEFDSYRDKRSSIRNTNRRKK